MQPDDVGFRTLRTMSAQYSVLYSIPNGQYLSRMTCNTKSGPRIGKMKLTKLSGSYVTRLSEYAWKEW